MIKITFPDGSVREFAKGTTAFQIAESISPRLAADSLAASVNGATVDMMRPIEEDASVKFYKWEDEEGKHAFWHTSSHLLAEALEALYPGIKFGIGPAIENGFYYDVDSPTPITEADLPKIEQKMQELSRNKEQLIRREVPKAEALKTFTEKGDQYKVELITDLQDGTISFYTNGAFTDLCRGPHIPNTGYIKALKLTSVAGAYWRGNEKNKMLTRIYGISFPKKSMLDEYLVMMEEAKKRDHRKLGKDLELFCFSQRVGQGLPLWLPKGAALRDRLEQFLRGVQKEYGYQQVITPHIGNKELYVTSGHYAKYGKDSFQPIHTPIEGEEYLLKPMNCPHHCEIYRSKPRSYKELPVRLAEFGTVYRYEQSGELHGLTRVRGFTQDDAHLFVRPDQLLEEFERVIDIVLYIFKTLKFDNYTAQISLRDPNNKEKYIGSDENWEKAESAIMQAAREKGLTTVVELGEAAFYGPKLDFMVKDAIGRKWQLGTIQVDYNLPERFDLTYKGGRTARAHGRQIPAVALAPAGRGTPDLGEVQRLCAESGRIPEPQRRPHRSRRPQREDRPQDPRQRAQAHPLPADRRREGRGRGPRIRPCTRRGRQGPDDDGSVPRPDHRAGQRGDRRQQTGKEIKEHIINLTNTYNYRSTETIPAEAVYPRE